MTNAVELNPGVVTVIASLLTKACKTFRAIQLTAEGGPRQDAAALARQLFETAAAVKFITQKDTVLRATMFAAHQDWRALVPAEEAAQTGLNRGAPEVVDMRRRTMKAWEAQFDDVSLHVCLRAWQ